jgi:hypothetical protein
LQSIAKLGIKLLRRTFKNYVSVTTVTETTKYTQQIVEIAIDCKSSQIILQRGTARPPNDNFPLDHLGGRFLPIDELHQALDQQFRPETPDFLTHRRQGHRSRFPN